MKKNQNCMPQKYGNFSRIIYYTYMKNQILKIISIVKTLSQGNASHNEIDWLRKEVSELFKFN